MTLKEADKLVLLAEHEDFLCLEKEHTTKGEWVIALRLHGKTYPNKSFCGKKLETVINKAFKTLCK